MMKSLCNFRPWVIGKNLQVNSLAVVEDMNPASVGKVMKFFRNFLVMMELEMKHIDSGILVAEFLQFAGQPRGVK